MSQSCDNNCSACGQSCPSRREEPDFSAPMNARSDIKKVIAVVSGKGGVGKSLVTSLLAGGMARAGAKTAILDADLTGPSIPKLFGLDDVRAVAEEDALLPAEAENGTKIMSVNLLLEGNTDPVIWRGPVLAGVVKQFWSDVAWGEVDYMFVDMPPGTGDVPLTVFQSLPVAGVVIVTSPQELVGMIVEKAVRMAEMMNVPVLGVVENMSYYQCPDCGKRHDIFGVSRIEEIAAQHGLSTVSRLPLDPAIAKQCDLGQAGEIDGPWLENMLTAIRGE